MKGCDHQAQVIIRRDGANIVRSAHMKALGDLLLNEKSVETTTHRLSIVLFRYIGRKEETGASSNFR
jgi:hypothetical protein